MSDSGVDPNNPTTWPVNFGQTNILDPTTQSSLDSLVPSLTNANSPLYASDLGQAVAPSVAPQVGGSLLAPFASSGSSITPIILIGGIALLAVLLMSSSNGGSKKK